MSTLPFDSPSRRWERKNSQSWRQPQAAHRSRRSILIAIACILCLGLWHHTRSSPPSLSPNRHELGEGDADFLSLIDRRSLPEDADWPFVAPAVDRTHPKSFKPEVKSILHSEGTEEEDQRLVFEENSQNSVDTEGTVSDTGASPNQATNDLPLEPGIVVTSGDGSGDIFIEPQIVEVPPDRLQKGPVAVQANLDPETEKAPLISSPDQPVKEKIIEAEPLDHLSLEEKADSLPEVVHIPFEDAVKDEVLHGWEDDWVAHASYDSKKWGKLEEPKIDFVYLCKRQLQLGLAEVATDMTRGERI